MKLPALPVYYYLDHFEEMLAFVGKTLTLQLQFAVGSKI